jgi:23S rRNA pseudouridine1911/1915/1917 synthase
MSRQALHATRLCLDHPASGRPLEFEAVPPPDFRSAWHEVAGV